MAQSDAALPQQQGAARSRRARGAGHFLYQRKTAVGEESVDRCQKMSKKRMRRMQVWILQRKKSVSVSMSCHSFSRPPMPHVVHVACPGLHQSALYFFIFCLCVCPSAGLPTQRRINPRASQSEGRQQPAARGTWKRSKPDGYQQPAARGTFDVLTGSDRLGMAGGCQAPSLFPCVRVIAASQPDPVPLAAPQTFNILAVCAPLSDRDGEDLAPRRSLATADATAES